MSTLEVTAEVDKENSKPTDKDPVDTLKENPLADTKDEIAIEENDICTEENCASGEVMCKGDKLSFKMIWNKKNYDMVKLGKENTVNELRKYIEELTGIPKDMQKIMYKGLVKDESKTLASLKIVDNAKLMVVGSTLKDVEKIKTTTSQSVQMESRKEVAAAKEPLCRQKVHRKVLDKGKPEDVPAGIKGIQEPLPQYPLAGMINKTGGKVRLTFKLELDELWIGTKERTEKIPMSSIRNVLSEPIEGSEEYHLLAIQLGPTDASRYWIYWFPAQYVDDVKDTILGKWDTFSKFNS